MTYKWEERIDLRFVSMPVETHFKRRARGKDAKTAETNRWKAALKHKAGDGPSAPRKFSWEND